MPKKYDGPGELIRAGWNMNGVTQLSVNPQIDIELWVLTEERRFTPGVALPLPLSLSFFLSPHVVSRWTVYRLVESMSLLRK